MPVKPESLLVNRIIKRLNEERPGFWMKIHGGPFQKAGLPDIIGCYGGQFVGLEVKQPGGVATPLQAQRLHKIHDAGGVAWVVHSPDEALSLVPSRD